MRRPPVRRYGSPVDGSSGRVLQVNVTAGGVPRRPVPEARVTTLGLAGDRHTADTVHGGPHRAVCLLGIEAIRRVAAEGHPIAPGTVGENLTTEGIELALLPTGTRLEIGAELLLEVTSPAMPCNLIEDSFLGRRSGRISILRFPSDSRMYARVLIEGTVRPGDAIRVLPPAADSRAVLHRQLDVYDAVERHAYLALWAAARAAGIDVEVLDDGELAVAATPALDDDSFNRALGLRQLPHLLGRVLARYTHAGTTGWLVADEAPWRDALPGATSTIYAAPAAPVDAPLPEGLVIRRIGAAEAVAWAEVNAAAFAMDDETAAAWRSLAPHLATAPGEQLLLAELDGVPVATAALYLRRRVGLLAAGAVLPAFRGRGVQPLLIADRIRRALDGHATAVMATATPGGPSARNLEAAGFERIWDRRLWRFDPVADRDLALVAAERARSG